MVDDFIVLVMVT